MDCDNKVNFSRWFYKVGAALLFVLSMVALIAFVKAVVADPEKNQIEKTLADSLQVEQLREEVRSLNQKVDSLLQFTENDK